MPSEQGVTGELFNIIVDTGVYRERAYKSEEELERLVVAHADDVFGKDTLYLDVKQRVASRLHVRVTDGILLDFRKKPIPHLWVVEYELDSHDLARHVIPQLRGFVKAFDNEETVTILRSAMYDEVTKNPEKLRKSKELAGENSELYYTLDQMLHGGATILLVYNRVPETIYDELEEADFHYDFMLMEFRTFEREGKMAHLVNPLTPFEVSVDMGEKQVIRSRKAGEQLNQVLEVVLAMRNGQSWNKACHAVASKKGIWHNTVMSATTRGLGLSGKSEFENYLQKGKLPELLLSKFPEAKSRVEAVFGPSAIRKE